MLANINNCINCVISFLISIVISDVSFAGLNSNSLLENNYFIYFELLFFIIIIIICFNYESDEFFDVKKFYSYIALDHCVVKKKVKPTF